MNPDVLEEILLDVRKEALDKGHSIVFSTKGKSMFPVLMGGDRITIVKLDKDKLRQGDIIIYRSCGDKKVFIAHRVIKKLRDKDKLMLITKGDSVFRIDLAIDSDNLIGRIIKIRKGYFDIPLQGFLGRAFNIILYFLSVTRVIAILYLFLRKAKHGAVFLIKGRSVLL